jgi:hypothetical protein
LSCLGDVIGALGRGDAGHVPYRNSKVRRSTVHFVHQWLIFDAVDLLATIFSWGQFKNTHVCYD